MLLQVRLGETSALLLRLLLPVVVTDYLLRVALTAAYSLAFCQRLT
jgi:hypothetical protein